jgi:nucleoside-diphosphate-sugar epimerase
VKTIETLLITGGSGFVGQSLLDHLSNLPKDNLPKVIGLTSRNIPVNVPPSLTKKVKIEKISCNLHDAWDFDFQATHVINLAGDGTQNAYSQDSAADFGLITNNLVNWCKSQNSPTIFHASSGACFFDHPENRIFSENEKLQDETSGEFTFAHKRKFYIQSRIASEKLLKHSEQEGILSLRIGRLFSFVGNHLRQKPQYAVSSFVEMAELNKKIELDGNPLTTRGLLSADDMASWIYRALDSTVDSSVLSIGSSSPVTMIELATFIANLSNSKIVILNPDSQADVYLADNYETCKRLQVIETIKWQEQIMRYMKIKS